jgi:hypothetical protein
MALAATLGTLRYSGIDSVLQAHRAASAWAGWLGVPLLAAAAWATQFTWQRSLQVLLQLWLPLAALAASVVVAAAAVESVQSLPRASMVSNGFAMLALIAAGARRGHAALLWAVAGVTSLLLAAFGSDPLSRWVGWDKLDIYHLMLALAMQLLVVALLRIGLSIISYENNHVKTSAFK